MISLLEEKVRYIKLHHADISIAYIDEYTNEDAPVILAIHGLGNSFVVWMNNFHQLKNHYRCIALDLPGNGLSEKKTLPYGIPYFSSIIKEFIEELGLKSVHLMGHSMGGQIALYTALHVPNYVDSLLLIAPAGFEEFSPIEKQIMTGSNQFLDYMMSGYDKLSQALHLSFYTNTTENKRVKDTLLHLLKLQDSLQYKKMLDACVSSMLNDSVLNDYNKIHHPTLIVFGTQDAMIPNKLFHPMSTEIFAKKAAGKIPHATLKLIKNAGHFVHFEQSNAVNTTIKDYLSNGA